MQGSGLHAGVSVSRLLQPSVRASAAGTGKRVPGSLPSGWKPQRGTSWPRGRCASLLRDCLRGRPPPTFREPRLRELEINQEMLHNRPNRKSSTLCPNACINSSSFLAHEDEGTPRPPS